MPKSENVTPAGALLPPLVPATEGSRLRGAGRWVGEHRRALAVTLLLFALVLRWCLVAQGGAYYWTDEKRYAASRDAVAALGIGDFRGAADHLLARSEHIGFRWLGLIPAAVEHASYGAVPPHAKLCAAFFSLFGVANLFLIWRIAARHAVTPAVPLLALGFAASSNSLFLFARHCFPYDASLTFLLCAVLHGHGSRRALRSMFVGLFCGLGYLTYNGYWSVAAVILVFHAIPLPFNGRTTARIAAAAGAGFIAPLLAVFTMSWAAGHDLLRHSIAFASTVNQGDFGHGARFLLEYLWVTDGLLPVGMLILMVGGAAYSHRRHDPYSAARWIAMACLLATVWIAFSDLWPVFVLYGRTVRALVPFLAIGAACAAGTLMQAATPGTRRLAWLGSGIACAGGFLQMAGPLQQTFPREFRVEAERQIAAARARDPAATFRIVNADYLFGPPEPVRLPPHREVSRQRHPHSYLPYLYEGYTRAQRPLYRRADGDLRLVELLRDRGQQAWAFSPRAAWLKESPGPLQIRLRLAPATPARAGTMETLLDLPTSGGQGDALVVRYESDDEICFGIIHNDDAPAWSAPVKAAAGDHVITLSMGSCYPDAPAPAESGIAPSMPGLRSHYLVRFDGQTLLKGSGTYDRAHMDGLHLGMASPKRGTLPPSFSGTIARAWQVDPATIVDAEWLPQLPPSRCFTEYAGPIELTVQFPAGAAGTAEPLVTTGTTGAADMVFIAYEGNGMVRFGFDHWGDPTILSEPIAVVAGHSYRVLISMGSAFPTADVPEYRAWPVLKSWRSRLLVKLDGTTAILRAANFFPASAASLKIGGCDTGASTAGPWFTGKISNVVSRGPDALGINTTGLPPLRGPFAGDYTGMIEMTVRFPTHASGTEPLLVTGKEGAADLLFVTYIEGGGVVIGVDHWGGGEAHSEQIAVEPGSTHRVTISMGSLFPPATDPTARARPALCTRWLLVRVDGRLILSQPFDFHRADPDAFWFGRNPFGGTIAGPAFTGEIVELLRVPVASRVLRD